MEENKQKNIAEAVSDDELSKVAGGANNPDPLGWLNYLDETASVEEMDAMMRVIQKARRESRYTMQDRERLSEELERLMTLYQDKMGAYNSYQQGANTVIHNRYNR